MNGGPIFIGDDDRDDREFLTDAWKELNFPNELVFFNNGEEVLTYLQNEKPEPFLILCDVNIPRMDGFSLKEKLAENASTKYKSIPFVFLSTTVSQKQVEKAYDMGVNGFFLKESNLNELKQSLVEIVKYWSRSKVPE